MGRYDWLYGVFFSLLALRARFFLSLGFLRWYKDRRSDFDRPSTVSGDGLVKNGGFMLLASDFAFGGLLLLRLSLPSGVVLLDWFRGSLQVLLVCRFLL